jgi:hypothetical protein
MHVDEGAVSVTAGTRFPTSTSAQSDATSPQGFTVLKQTVWVAFTRAASPRKTTVPLAGSEASHSETQLSVRQKLGELSYQ